MRADAVVVGTGAGGAVVAEGARRGRPVGRDARGGRAAAARATSPRARATSPRASTATARRSMTLGNVADRAAARPRGRRHDDPQLGHVLPHAAARCSTRWGLWTRRRARPVLPPRRAHLQRLPRPARDRRAQRARSWSAAPSGSAGRASTCTAPRAAASARASARSAARAAASSTPATPTSRSRGTPARSRSPARAPRKVVARARRRSPARPAAARLRVDAAARRRRVRDDPHAGAAQALRARATRRSARNLSLHPATGVWAEFDEDVDMSRAASRRPTRSTSSPPRGSCSRAGPARRTCSRCRCPPTGDEHRRLVMPAARRVAQAGLMIRDDSRGRVHSVGGRPVIRYDVNRADTALLVRGDRPRRRARARRRGARASTCRSAARRRSRRATQAARADRARRSSSASPRSTRSAPPPPARVVDRDLRLRRRAARRRRLGRPVARSASTRS